MERDGKTKGNEKNKRVRHYEMVKPTKIHVFTISKKSNPIMQFTIFL